ncbi:hypothetical protein [Peribacillus frigoritolerans]|uniref:hypothetical protein n=1 Tax=Peribacillus frigoritolerans TaxID=450367 RepID=UPI0030158C2B
MNESYLTGYLTYNPSIDTVSLVHKILGRSSYMDLENGDHIEIFKNGIYQEISVREITNETIKNNSREHRGAPGQSLYEGVKVRVMLSEKATRKIECYIRKRKTLCLFNSVVSKNGLTFEEATEILSSWEAETED